MRQDPHAVPHQRASYEQASHQQPPAQWLPYHRRDAIQPRSADPETEAALAQVRVAQRKAKRMQVACVLLGVCAAAVFLVAAASHQLDGHIEMLTPVLLLTSAVNFRRYAQRAANYRAAETDMIAASAEFHWR